MKNRNILSAAAQNAMPSGVRRMFELAKNYPDAINLTLGEPGFTTPQHMIEAAVESLRAGKTKYTPNAGIKPLRDAIAWKLKNENGIECDPDKNLIVTAGAAAIGATAGLVARLLPRRDTLRVALATAAAHLIGSMIIKTFGLYQFYGILVLWRIPLYTVIASLEIFVLCRLCRRGILRRLTAHTR